MVYAPGTLETDPKKQNMALQQQASAIKTNTTDIATKITGPASSTDNAAVRFDLATGKLVQDSALVIADTTGAVSRTGGGGIPVQGTNTNDNAAAGNVGEYISSTVARGSAVSLTTGIAANVTSISLTAGDWDVVGQIGFAFGATTTATYVAGGSSSSSANLPSSVPQFQYPYAISAGSADVIGPIPAGRFSLSATTTIYLVAQSGFSVSTNKAYGYIQARRAR